MKKDNSSWLKSTCSSILNKVGASNLLNSNIGENISQNEYDDSSLDSKNELSPKSSKKYKYLSKKERDFEENELSLSKSYF